MRIEVSVNYQGRHFRRTSAFREHRCKTPSDGIRYGSKHLGFGRSCGYYELTSAPNSFGAQRRVLKNAFNSTGSAESEALRPNCINSGTECPLCQLVAGAALDAYGSWRGPIILFGAIGFVAMAVIAAVVRPQLTEVQRRIGDAGISGAPRRCSTATR
jgi:hypothetical protein